MVIGKRATVRPRIEGVSPGRCCVVPTRDPSTGESCPKFVKTLARNRNAKLPGWVILPRKQSADNLHGQEKWQG